MRYIKQEPVIHTVSDEEISDDKAIFDILSELKTLNQSFFMEFDDPQSPGFCNQCPNVRIMALREKDIDIQSFMSSASMKYKNIPIYSIRKIKLLANKQAMARKYRVSRWHMLDVAEVEGV